MNRRSFLGALAAVFAGLPVFRSHLRRENRQTTRPIELATHCADCSSKFDPPDPDMLRHNPNFYRADATWVCRRCCEYRIRAVGVRFTDGCAEAVPPELANVRWRL